MITVNNDFKNALLSNGKLISAQIVKSGTTYDKSDINNINLSYDGDLLRTNMRALTIEVDSLVSWQNDLLSNVKFGVKSSPVEGYAYIDYGPFRVFKNEQSKEDGTTTLTCYDSMIDAMIPYDLTITYPTTLAGLLSAICIKLGWTLGTTGTFINSSQIITEEKYDKSYTYRDVLDEIAQASASIIGFKPDNKLYVIYPTASGESITGDYLKTLTIGKKYGPVNSIVLARTPQEDNIFRQDSTSIATYGLTEIKIENNQLVDDDRDSWITGIYNQLLGLEYYTYELESFGICFFEIGDKFALQDENNNNYPTIWLHTDLQITQGISEDSYVEEMEKTNTDYKAGDTTDKRLRQTNLKVDKQQQSIDALVLSVDDNTEDIASLTISVGNISSTVSQQSTIIGNLSSTVTQTANSVSSIVQSVGAGGTVTSSSIIQSINNNTSTLKISADKIDIAGAEFPTISNQSTGDDLAEITTLYTRSGGTAKGIKYTAKYHEFNATEDFEVNALDDIELEAVGGTNNIIRLTSDGDVNITAVEDITVSSGAGSIILSETDGEIRISSTSNSIYLDTTGSTTADIHIDSGDYIYIDAVDDIRMNSEDKIRVESAGELTITGPYTENVLTIFRNYVDANTEFYGCQLEFNYDDATLYATSYLTLNSADKIYNSCGGRMYLSPDTYLYLSGTRIYWNGSNITDYFDDMADGVL